MRDVLTDVLDALRLRSTVYCQSEIGKAGWALRFGATTRAAFHIVSEGGCWINVVDQRLRLDLGDLLVLPHGDAHLIADAPGSPVCADIQLEQTGVDDCILMRWGDGEPRTTLVCGTFDLDRHAEVFALLPPIVHFRAEQARDGGLQPTIHALIEEANAQRSGRQTVLTRLADVLLVLVIRAWLANADNEARGWLAALRDPQITLALEQMHAAPAQEWTVAQLATTAAMSRSAFAARFVELVGEPPLRYLTRWRMQVAARLLENPRTPLSHIAEQVGYESDAAFNKAFKRERGISPGQYQRQARGRNN